MKNYRYAGKRHVSKRYFISLIIMRNTNSKRLFSKRSNVLRKDSLLRCLDTFLWNPCCKNGVDTTNENWAYFIKPTKFKLNVKFYYIFKNTFYLISFSCILIKMRYISVIYHKIIIISFSRIWLYWIIPKDQLLEISRCYQMCFLHTSWSILLVKEGFFYTWRYPQGELRNMG
jgi:hypothetical protein